MKSLFFYLVLISLFVMGAKLVNRQQTYVRSIQASTPAKPQLHAFQQYLQLAVNSVKQSYRDVTAPPPVGKETGPLTDITKPETSIYAN